MATKKKETVRFLITDGDLTQVSYLDEYYAFGARTESEVIEAIIDDYDDYYASEDKDEVNYTIFELREVVVAKPGKTTVEKIRR
jgi:hypothetical protein